MQQGITRRDVYQPVLAARIGGRDIELASAAIDRALPDPVQQGSLTAASATLSTVEGPDVTDTVATPWGPGTSWPPVPETAASVSMDTGRGPVSLLTNGRVISADGGTSDRAVEVEVADQYQSLDRTISWDAVAAAMPSLEDRGTSRYVSMLTSSIADLILRHCGWYATPPNLSWNTLEVPGMGTMWPARGTVEVCGRETDANHGGYPEWPATSWGVGVGDCHAEYRMAGAYKLTDQGRVELTAMTSPTVSGWSTLAVQTESRAGMVRLMWSGTQAVIQARGTSGTYAEIARVAHSGGFLYATVRYGGPGQVEGIIRSDGKTVEGTLAVDSRVISDPLRYAEIVSQPGAGNGGFQVAFPASSGTLASWVPNAVQKVRGPSRNHLMVRRSVEGENCADFLQRLCEVDTATYWIDETGVLRWWDLARLEALNPVATLTADDDIDEAGFQWKHSLSSVKNRVSVGWAEPLRTWSWTTSVDLHQGSGSTVQAGADEENWITTPDDEVWLMPDTSITRAPGSGSVTSYNYGWGSWYGGRMDRGDGVDTWVQLAGEGSFVQTLERVTDRAFKLRTTWTGTVPVVQKAITAATGGSVWMARRDTNLPIIRGKARYKLLDRYTYSSQTGPATAPELEIDAGWLLQYENQAQYVADYYGARMTIPQPVLSSVALIPVPGLQLGDVVELAEDAVTNLTIRGVVINDSRSINADMGMRHAVAIRPVAVSRNRVTWAEWASVMAGKTWTQWATGQNSTWAEWGSDPLGKE